MSLHYRISLITDDQDPAEVRKKLPATTGSRSRTINEFNEYGFTIMAT